MEPGSFGKKLGIGVRVASRVVKEHVGAHARQSATEAAAKEQAARKQTGAGPTATSGSSQVEAASRAAAASVRQTTEKTAQTVRQQAPVVAAKARGIGEGARRFGRALWGPFAHVSSVLWSEVTGLFFGIFTAYFARGIYLNRAGYVAAHPDHRRFLLDIAMTVIFGYFTLSSFYIARRKEKKNRR